MEDQQISIIEQFGTFVTQASAFVWGHYVLIPLLLGVGIFLMIRFRGYYLEV